MDMCESCQCKQLSLSETDPTIPVVNKNNHGRFWYKHDDIPFEGSWVDKKQRLGTENHEGKNVVYDVVAPNKDEDSEKKSAIFDIADKTYHYIRYYEVTPRHDNTTSGCKRCRLMSYSVIGVAGFVAAFWLGRKLISN
ncbi:uncharacterized protein LOC127851421 [Dreissena polymorpha]|uniref:Uncharacterized protein n=1 Tax=Dreissena polymorpha TaxID=45954 RepID=A0A9D4D044_DREPO|nr:uncharacterized protein LOC127851421 [Dreissena polymorpha]KAH3736663.1 hypothetical protein DPMN_043235 [Dreissena polymorpha]